MAGKIKDNIAVVISHRVQDALPANRLTASKKYHQGFVQMLKKYKNHSFKNLDIPSPNLSKFNLAK